jgi:hypothetical protein
MSPLSSSIVGSRRVDGDAACGDVIIGTRPFCHEGSRVSKSLRARSGVTQLRSFGAVRPLHQCHECSLSAADGWTKPQN